MPAAIEPELRPAPADPRGSRVRPRAPSPWSDELRVCVRPVETYAELAREGASASDLVARIGRLLVTLGVFVSITTAGRLVPSHVASTVLFWSFVPLLQAVAVLVAIGVAARGRVRAIDALSRYFAGHAPWLFALLLVSGACLIAPDVPAFGIGVLRSRGFLLAILVPFVWGVVLTASSFVVGLGLGKRRGALATALFYATYFGLLIAWYVGIGQVQTLLEAT